MIKVEIILQDLIDKIEKRYRDEFKDIIGVLELKIDFEGPDALWISKDKVYVRGKENTTGYYKFWEASSFSDYRDAEEVLNDREQLKKVEGIEILSSTGKKSFDTWEAFLRWLS